MQVLFFSQYCTWHCHSCFNCISNHCQPLWGVTTTPVDCLLVMLGFDSIDGGEISDQVGERINAVEAVVTVAWEKGPKKLPQGHAWPAVLHRIYHFRALTETLHWSASDLKYRISPPTMADKTDCTMEDRSWDNFYVAEEATWGCRRPVRLSFLPTPPSHLLLFNSEKSLKKQNLRQGRGVDICREE